MTIPRRAWMALVMAGSIGCAQLTGLSEHLPNPDASAGDGAVDPRPGTPDASAVSPIDGALEPDAESTDGAVDREAPPAGCRPLPDTGACAAGYASCDIGGCLVHLTTDPNNCGACGRSCRGSECQDSECQRVAVATDLKMSHRRLVAFNSTAFYFGTADGNVHSRLVATGGPVTVATGEGSIQGIAVDDEFAYVMTQGGRCTMGWCLRRLPLDTTGTLRATTLARVGDDSGGIVIDDRAIYWFDSKKGFGTPSIVRLAKNVPGDPQDLAIDEGKISGIALDDEYVYWGSKKIVDGDGIIKRARLDGTSPSPEHVVELPATAPGTRIAVDGENVYFTDILARTIQVAPKRGGGPVTTLATTEDPPLEIAVDDVNVYWGLSEGFSDLFKVSRCGGAPRRLALGASVGGIVARYGYVFWNDDISGVFAVAQ